MNKTEASAIVDKTRKDLGDTRTALLKFISDVAGNDVITFKEPSTVTVDGEDVLLVNVVKIDATHIYADDDQAFDIADEVTTDTLQYLADELFRTKFVK